VAVAGVAEDLGGILMGGDGFLKPAHLSESDPEVAERHAFAVAVAGGAEDLGGVLDLAESASALA
jgi:hypothetical protein